MIRTVTAPKGRARRTPLDRLTDRSKEIPCSVKGLHPVCWVTTHPEPRHGYSRVQVGGRGGRILKAHRVAYAELIGEIPEGLELDHLCRNRACWNPWHTEPVTQRVNILRGVGIAAQYARRTATRMGCLSVCPSIPAQIRAGAQARQTTGRQSAQAAR